MTFTPSPTRSFVAGSVFWSMVWAILAKLNGLAGLFGFKDANPRDHVLNWKNTHEILTVGHLPNCWLGYRGYKHIEQIP